MALFEVTAYDKKVYEEELKDFLPDKMLDVHTHVYKDELRPQPWRVNGELKRTSNTWVARVAVDDPIEELMETYELMFPGKDVKALMFCNGLSDANNDYVRDVSAKYGWPALYYSRSCQSADEVEKKIREGNFLGLKSYLSQSPSYIPVRERRILDFFPEYQLKRMDEMGAIVMCHIPRDGRLKDPVNLYQLVEIANKYPNIHFIVAHVGRAYTEEDLGNSFEILKDAPGLLYDFSANCCDAAIRAVIEHAGTKKVMFGTDMPILRMRTHRIEENGTYINLVPPGLYGTEQDDPHLREVSEEEAKQITFFAYEELLSFKRVAQQLKLSRQDVEDILYNNAMDMVDAARTSIYGA